MNHELFGRDGHLTMLSCDRYDAGELGDMLRHDLESHAEGCPRCRERLNAVMSPGLALLPPPRAQHETGSIAVASLATTAGVALAASLVAAIGAAVWPSPRLAAEREAETAGMASAYTSVAQEYSEPGWPQLTLAPGGRRVTVRAAEWSRVAVVILSRDDEGGTGGTEGPMVLEVLYESSPGPTEASVAVPATWAGQRVVAVGCPDEASVAVGTPLPVDAGCSMATPTLVPGAD